MNLQVAFLWAFVTGQWLCGYQFVQGVEIQMHRSMREQHRGLHAKADVASATIVQNSSNAALTQPPQDKHMYTALTSLWASAKQLFFKEEEEGPCGCRPQHQLPCCKKRPVAPVIPAAPAAPVAYSRGAAGVAAVPALMSCLGCCTLCVIITVFFGAMASLCLDDDKYVPTVAAPLPRPRMPPPQRQGVMVSQQWAPPPPMPVRESVRVGQPYVVESRVVEPPPPPQVVEKIVQAPPQIVEKIVEVPKVVASPPQIIEKIVERPPQVIEKIVASPPQIIEKIVERPPQVIEKIVEVPIIQKVVETIQPTVVETVQPAFVETIQPAFVETVQPAAYAVPASTVEYVMISGQQVRFYEIFHLQSLNAVELRQHAMKLNSLFGPKIVRPLPVNDAELVEWIMYVQNEHVTPLRRGSGGFPGKQPAPVGMMGAAPVGGGPVAGEFVMIGGQQIAFYEPAHLVQLQPAQLRQHAVSLQAVLGPKIGRPVPVNDAELVEWIRVVQDMHVAPFRRVGGAGTSTSQSVTMPASFASTTTVGGGSPVMRGNSPYRSF